MMDLNSHSTEVSLSQAHNILAPTYSWKLLTDCLKSLANYCSEEQSKAVDHGVMSVLLCVCNLSFKIEKESQIR